ncbi:hypothetical protein ABFS83_06G076000 [Erythranthe nasuta]
MEKVDCKRKSKLSEEDIELKKRVKKMLGPDWKPMTIQAEEIFNRLSENRKKNNKYFGRLVKPIDSIYNDVIYEHLHSNSYPPETVQSMNTIANVAIDVFNQKQPIIKYSVVDVVRVTRLLIPGYIVHVLFTAKPDGDGEGPVTSFDANLRYFCGRAEEVTYVDIEYIPPTST